MKMRTKSKPYNSRIIFFPGIVCNPLLHLKGAFNFIKFLLPSLYPLGNLNLMAGMLSARRKALIGGHPCFSSILSNCVNRPQADHPILFCQDDQGAGKSYIMYRRMDQNR